MIKNFSKLFILVLTATIWISPTTAIANQQTESKKTDSKITQKTQDQIDQEEEEREDKIDRESNYRPKLNQKLFCKNHTLKGYYYNIAEKKSKTNLKSVKYSPSKYVIDGLTQIDDKASYYSINTFSSVYSIPSMSAIYSGYGDYRHYYVIYCIIKSPDNSEWGVTTLDDKDTFIFYVPMSEISKE